MFDFTFITRHSGRSALQEARMVSTTSAKNENLTFSHSSLSYVRFSTIVDRFTIVPAVV